MAMNVLQSPSRPGLGKVSGFFWRNPGLGLFLLLLGPLMWFGIVYFGSLLTLLWQGFYTAPFWLFQWRGIWRAIPAGK